MVNPTVSIRVLSLVHVVKAYPHPLARISRQVHLRRTPTARANPLRCKTYPARPLAGTGVVSLNLNFSVIYPSPPRVPIIAPVAVVVIEPFPELQHHLLTHPNRRQVHPRTDQPAAGPPRIVAPQHRPGTVGPTMHASRAAGRKAYLPNAHVRTPAIPSALETLG